MFQSTSFTGMPIARGAVSLAILLMTGAALAGPYHGRNDRMRPLRLDRPGHYTLDRDLIVDSGDAVTISASGVTLDLNGHSVGTKAPGMGLGIFVEDAKGVTVKNGQVGGFHFNVRVEGSENVTIHDVSVVGLDLAPSGGPSEVGIHVLNSRGCVVRHNTVTSVNLGIFVQGPAATGNRIASNTVTGSVTPSKALLGLCYNPVGMDDPTGPSGDLIENNHIARYMTAVSLTADTKGNILRGNTLAYLEAAYTPATDLAANVAVDNIMVDLTP